MLAQYYYLHRAALLKGPLKQVIYIGEQVNCSRMGLADRLQILYRPIPSRKSH